MSLNYFPIGGGLSGAWSIGDAHRAARRAEEAGASRRRGPELDIESNLLIVDRDCGDAPRRGRRRRRGRGRGEGRGPDLTSGEVDLADLWGVPDQGPRGTCTAFAINAAEELWRTRQAVINGSPDPVGIEHLSAEYLYAKMSQIAPTDHGVEVDGDAAEALLSGGARYIVQGREALDQWGICREDEAPYDKTRRFDHQEGPFSQSVEDSAATRKVPAEAWQHDIVQVVSGPVIGLNQLWMNQSQSDDPEVQPSKIFHDALAQGSPVVAAFALLNYQGRSAWQGSRPRLCGQIIYPDDGDLGGVRPIGGHVVCLTGFVPDGSGRHGTFVFRNSLGDRDFAWWAEDENRCPEVPGLRGYGTISSQDVDRYCWEYMFRRP